MSFFDEDEEPLRTTSRTRSRPRPRRGSPAGPARADSQNVLVRRMVAVFVVLFFIIVAGAFIRSCSSNRHKDALRDYNRQVSGIAQTSAQLGDQFFKLLGQGANQSPQTLQGQVNSFRAQADTQLTQARALSTPSEMQQAQQSFLIALEQRRDGLESIATEIRTALGDNGNQADRAIRQIAAQMRYFDSSDVLYASRVKPFIQDAIKQADIAPQDLASSVFMKEINWVAPQFVATKLGQQLSTTSSGGTTKPQTTGPGLHGTGLNATSYGNTTLSPTATNRLTYVAGQAFTVSFTNQGDNEEFNVKVTVKITQNGKTVMTLQKTQPTIVKGQKATVSLPLNRTPPTETAVVVSVNVAAVPGEKKTDNNKSDYPTLFVSG